MEPVTHLLTGACLARSGFSRRLRYCTLAMAIAAEFPDIDTLWSLKGPIASFQHHRGLTHTLLGIPFEAALLVAGVYAYHRLWGQRHSLPKTTLRPPATNWLALFGCLLLALLSHLLLDYTNNYGIRPFFPFNARWYAASWVFIFDPLLFVLLVAGLLMPLLFGLVGREISGTPQVRGTGWPRAALLAVGALWAVRAIQHGKALTLAAQQSIAAPSPSNNPQSLEADAVSVDERPRFLQPIRSTAGPDPFSPFRWYIASDFGPAYRLGLADTRQGSLTPGTLLTKADPSPLFEAARQSRLGRIYLDWSQMPLLITEPAAPDSALPPSAARVLFEDLRFMGDIPFFHQGGLPPLSGYVDLRPDATVIRETLNGRSDK